MFNSLRKLLRPTLRQQLEDGVRQALRRYADRRTAPDLQTGSDPGGLPYRRGLTSRSAFSTNRRPNPRLRQVAKSSRSEPSM